ncbi:MAG: S4 domain-containing protein, partial [Gammaproteobacteria bacterium]
CEIVDRFHGEGAGEAARERFIARFRKGDLPDDMPALEIPGEAGKLGIAHLLRAAGLVSSNSEAFRMINQGAVRVDGDRIGDRELEVVAGTTHVYQVGKRRFARVTVV